MNWFKKSLFAKLMVGVLIATVIPYTMSNVISYITTTKSVEHQFIELNQNSMERSMGDLKRYLHDLNRISVSLYYDETLMSYLRMRELLPIQTLYIDRQVGNLYYQRPEFQAVSFTTSSPQQRFTKLDFSRIGVPSSDISIINGEIKGYEEYEVGYVGEERVFVLNRMIVDYPSSKLLGLLSLYVGLSDMKTLIRSLSDPSEDRVFLYINDQDLLYSSEYDTDFVLPKNHSENYLLSDRGFYSGELYGQKGIFVYVKEHYLDLPITLIKFLPSASINESANQTLSRSLLIQSIAIVFVLILAAVLSYLMITPVKRLLHNITRVEIGNFELNRTSNRSDELGVLENRFQSMVEKLDELMNREYRNRLELTSAQLKMLQAQINPHFLYNALQSIGTLALRHNAEDVSDKIAELGAIMRYNMDLKKEIVTVKSEVDHIEQYLSLQTGRFKSRLSYTLNCSKDALEVRVPKMILQPLVENCIIHGIEKGTGSGTLHISIEMNPELCIRVIDNGRGIEAAVRENLISKYSEFQIHSGQEGGIGLINVLHRMRLFFGQGFDWDIQSIPYQTTIIELRVTADCLTKEEE
jgi:two-component system sensor histidine kinase YesM